MMAASCDDDEPTDARGKGEPLLIRAAVGGLAARRRPGSRKNNQFKSHSDPDRDGLRTESS